MLRNTGTSGLSRRRMWCGAVVLLAALMPLQLVARTPVRGPAPDSPTVQAPAEATVEQRAIEDQRRQLEKDIEAVRRALADREEALQKSKSARQERDADALRAELEALRRLAQDRQVAALALAEHDKRLQQDEALQRLRAAAGTVRALSRNLEQKQAEQLEEIARAQRERDAVALERAEKLRTFIEREQSILQQFNLERAANYARGDVVVLAPAADGTRPPASRVLAAPGDRILVTRSRIAVNDVAVTDLSSDFLAGLPGDRWEQTVPPGHYFVAAEQRSETGVTRFWGLIPSTRIAGRR